MSAILVPIDGEPIWVEVEPQSQYGSQPTTSAEKVMKQTKEMFDHAQTTIALVSSKLARSIKNMDQALAPETFELEFGLKFSAEGTVMLASATAECALKVKMSYTMKRE